jgi:hypothetical protein
MAFHAFEKSDVKRYKKMRNYGKPPKLLLQQHDGSYSGQKQKKGKRKLGFMHLSPRIFKWLLYFVLYALVTISLYLYMDGNCYFNNFRVYNEDNETDDPNYIRGLVVLLCALCNWALEVFWIRSFFRWRRYNLASLCLVIMLALSATILWAMGSTQQCLSDTLTNRYWIAFALYLIYAIWLCVCLSVSLAWWRLVGSRLDKTKPAYHPLKARHLCKKSKKKQNRYAHGLENPHPALGAYSWIPEEYRGGSGFITSTYPTRHSNTSDFTARV